MRDVLSGRRALVTGASRGIGRAIAIELGSRGASVAVNYVSMGRLAEEVVNAIKDMGSDSFAVRADVSDYADIARVLKSVATAWGGIDIVVHNAIDTRAFAPVAAVRDDAFMHTVNSHLTPLVAVARLAHEVMVPGGSIVSVSSLGSRFCLKNYAAVGVGKAALECLTRYLAQELSEMSISVNAVCAGPVDTSALTAFCSLEEMEAVCRKHLATKTVARPSDVAKIVAFLATDAAKLIVGQTIVADGGASLLDAVTMLQEKRPLIETISAERSKQ